MNDFVYFAESKQGMIHGAAEMLQTALMFTDINPIENVKSPKRLIVNQKIPSGVTEEIIDAARNILKSNDLDTCVPSVSGEKTPCYVTGCGNKFCSCKNLRGRDPALIR